MKERLIQEFNNLKIADMGEVKELFEGKGKIMDLDFLSPCGDFIKNWDENKTCYINQIEKSDGKKYYGLIADEKYLLVCEYGMNGADGKVVIFKRWQ